MLANKPGKSSPKSQQIDRGTWYKHLQAYQTSGQSKADYCHRHELVYHQFLYWCQKFEEEQSVSKRSHDPAFIPVKMKSSTSLPILCTLELGGDKHLLVHDESVLKTLIDFI